MATLAYGHCGRRHAVAAGRGGSLLRHRVDHDAGEESDAGRGGDVSCRLKRRSRFFWAECSGHRRLAGEAARLERGANGARGECRSAHRLRPDRRRSNLWIALGGSHRIVVCAATVAASGFGVGNADQVAQIFDHPFYLAGMVVMALLAGLMIFLPLSSAGDPNEPAPPTAMM